MKRRILVWLKRPFLLAYWFFKRMVLWLPLTGKKLSRKRKKIYETHVEKPLKFSSESPYSHIASPPFTLKISGSCLVLSKYLALTIYNEARSYNRWQEIYAFILGKRFGDLFIGTTFVPITNELFSPTEAAPELSHVMELESVIASRYPELETVCIVHSHPSGILDYSEADRRCFLTNDHPNIIVSPRKLLSGSPLKRMAAYYHYMGEVRRIKIYETDKEEPDLKDIDLNEITPSKEELMDIGELATEVDFGVFKAWITSHPNVTMKQICRKLSGLFGEKMNFIPVYKSEEGWVHDPDMKAVEFFMKNGEHLIFPELLGEVKE